MVMTYENWWWLVPMMIWDAVWKGLGLWSAARNGHKGWFVALLLINSLGVVPIIYLKWFAKKAAAVVK